MRQLQKNPYVNRNISGSERQVLKSLRDNNNIRDFAFFFFFFFFFACWTYTKHQPRRNLHSYLVLQRPCNEAALSPGIDAFWN